MQPFTDENFLETINTSTNFCEDTDAQLVSQSLQPQPYRNEQEISMADKFMHNTPTVSQNPPQRYATALEMPLFRGIQEKEVNDDDSSHMIIDGGESAKEACQGLADQKQQRFLIKDQYNHFLRKEPKRLASTSSVGSSICVSALQAAKNCKPSSASPALDASMECEDAELERYLLKPDDIISSSQHSKLVDKTINEAHDFYKGEKSHLKN